MKRIKDILYVRFAVPDLTLQQSFLEDFGFQVTYHEGQLIARGTGQDPYLYIATEGSSEGDNRFIGLGFEAEDRAALDAIAAIDNAAVEPITDLPGGGYRARLTDPDGFEVDIVAGVAPATPTEVTTRNPLNSDQSTLRLGERVVLPYSPHIVKRLGHCVINVTDFRTSEAWYKERIGFITSDEVYIGEESNALGAFMRINREEEYVDHHTLFCVGTGEPGFNHAAFEVTDWDALMLGHDKLKAADYEHRWGVGKHLLGSQVFDYWKDPHGFTLEHFTDGDLFNESFGSHKQPIDRLLAVHWGPEGMP